MPGSLRFVASGEPGAEPELPADMTGVHEHDVAGTDGHTLRRRGAVELVGTDRKSGFEVLGSEMAGDVEQHAPPDDAAREVVHTQAAGASRRGDQAGPVSVVEGGVAADVAEPVELGRRLQAPSRCSRPTPG